VKSLRQWLSVILHTWVQRNLDGSAVQQCGCRHRARWVRTVKKWSGPVPIVVRSTRPDNVDVVGDGGWGEVERIQHRLSGPWSSSSSSRSRPVAIHSEFTRGDVVAPARVWSYRAAAALSSRQLRRDLNNALRAGVPPPPGYARWLPRRPFHVCLARCVPDQRSTGSRR